MVLGFTKVIVSLCYKTYLCCWQIAMQHGLPFAQEEIQRGSKVQQTVIARAYLAPPLK